MAHNLQLLLHAEDITARAHDCLRTLVCLIARALTQPPHRGCMGENTLFILRSCPLAKGDQNFSHQRATEAR